MNSEARFKYYEYYIDNANRNMLESIKQDVFFDKNTNKLNLNHYMKLSRLIVKKKKALDKEDKLIESISATQEVI